MWIRMSVRPLPRVMRSRRDSVTLAAVRPGRTEARWAALAWALIVQAGAHAWATFPKAKICNVDEAYLIAFALRMIDGRFLPYVDAVSLRGPVLYYLTALVVRCFGPGIGSIRALSFLC